MAKTMNNATIIVLIEKERNKIKDKVESICSDIEYISNKLKKLKNSDEKDFYNLDLINSNMLKFESFRKEITSLWGKHLKEKIKDNSMFTMDVPIKANKLEKLAKPASSNIVKDKTDLVLSIVEKLEETFGKLIPLKSVNKALEDRMTTREINETIEKLLKNGDIFRPKKGFLLRM